MKPGTAILILIAVLLTSCAPRIPPKEVQETSAVPTAVVFTQTAMTVEPVVMLAPTATEMPTQAPSQTPASCLTLLTPTDGAEIPAIGKVTFSWTPLDSAMFYALLIVQPSGATTTFGTQLTSRGQYMEAFSAGGQYQWKVVAQDRKRNEICSSELATFDKPASNLPNQPAEEENKRKK